MAKDDNTYDPNPFVAFRRYTDAQIASIFNSLYDPFRQDPHDSERRKAQEDLWKRFERSYDRATSPTRTQTERDSDDTPPARSAKPRELPGFGRELEDRTGPYSPSEVRRRELARHQEGLLSHMLGFFGKTSTEEESARSVGHDWAIMQNQEAKKSHEHAEEIGKRIDRCPWVQEQGREEERAQVIDRGVNACPYAREALQEDDERETPYGLSWSWGPWGYEMGSRRQHLQDSEEDSEGGRRTEQHTFGPWSFGPFHIGSMSMSASLPRDMEAEFQRAFEHMQQKRQEIVAESRQRLGIADVQQAEGEESDKYAPPELMRREGFRNHLNWRQAFEDLMASETGEPMLGGTPWSSPANESDDSWRARLQDRGLCDPEDAWHRRMLGLEQHPHRKPQTSQEAPHTELELYDRLAPRPATVDDRIVQPSRPDILSTVTTVESVINPDGSTTVKRTLKRQFADGRVEKEESNESTPARVPQVAGAAPKAIESPVKPTMAEQLKGEKEKKGSWFWS